MNDKLQNYSAAKVVNNIAPVNFISELTQDDFILNRSVELI